MLRLRVSLVLSALVGAKEQADLVNWPLLRISRRRGTQYDSAVGPSECLTFQAGGVNNCRRAAGLYK